MKSSSNLNISCKVVFSLNKWNKKVGSPSSFRRKRPFISLNSSASIENLSSSECARAYQAKNDAQKGCAMQLNGITLKTGRGGGGGGGGGGEHYLGGCFFLGRVRPDAFRMLKIHFSS